MCCPLLDGVNFAYGEQRKVFGVLRNEPIVFLEDCVRCEYCRIFRDVAFLRGLAFVSDIALYLNNLNAAAAYVEMLNCTGPVRAHCAPVSAN